MASEKGAKWKNNTLGDLCTVKHKGRTIILLKPSTYMNLSGKSVRFWMQKHKIKIPNLLVVLDDLNLPFGKMRMRAKGKDGGHNGLKDIDKMLGQNNYARLRFGIGSDYHKGQQVDFVLGKWTSEEQVNMGPLKEKARKAILAYATIGASRAMSEFNG
jgi:PTH1 family peptidyl-tRNA hydrolase